MKRLDGKRAFITGAGGGIGRAFAQAFSDEGAIVCMADINAELVTAAAAEIPNATACVLDVTDRAAVHAAIGAFAEDGGLDIMINNAVVFHYAPLVDTPEEKVHQLMEVGAKGAFWGTQAATPHIAKQGGGSIINMSSVALSFSITNASIYTAVKGAVDAFSRQQAVELADRGIRVNTLAPGPVKTPGTRSAIDDKGWDTRLARVPLKRHVTDTEVAAAAVFLASEEGRSITGVTLKIDAGITIVGT